MAGCKPSKPIPATPTPSPTPAPTPPPTPTPTPTPAIPRKPIDVAKLFSGITVINKLETPPSDFSAATERKRKDSYRVEVKVTVERPRPAVSLEDMKVASPTFADVIGTMPGLLETAEVAPAFETLYDLKGNWIKERLGMLDQLLTPHNYYDCDTILHLSSPVGRKALLMVGDMDVNTDGSDGDRNVVIDDSSQFFQPQTSYRWRKQTERVNPFLTKAEKRLAELKLEQAAKDTTPARKAQIKTSIEDLNRRIYDLKTWSFLISDTDPYIVVPGFMLRGEGDFAPKLGDYAVVVHKGKVYPAVLGDAGPSFKMGEASMRLCKELNSRSSAISRPVSDLEVAYFIFPGSADPAAPPDMEKWNKRCQELWVEMGGRAEDVVPWKDIVPPWPTPTPSPTPTPEPSPISTTGVPQDLTPTPAPSVSPQPSVTPQ